MSRGLNKSERLREMERLYSQRAFSDIEMAARLDVDRTTVYRDRQALSPEVPIGQDKDSRWKIDREKYLSHIRVNLNEALALYLAARRASQQTKIAHKHMASALEKLALALKQPMTEKLVKAADVILSQKSSPEKVGVVETITRGWVEGIRLRIKYRGLKARQSLTHLVSPYLIEPSPWSDSTYLIAFSDVFEKVTTFKIGRIESARLTTEQFSIPQDFDEQTMLKHAWGIWRAEGEPKTVCLKFSPGIATRRLQESTWHPLEEVTNTEDGGCIWKAPIAEWREMLPWLRGWGADCEVLGPTELRETLIGQAKAMAERYGWHISSLTTAQSSTLDDFYGG